MKPMLQRTPPRFLFTVLLILSGCATNISAESADVASGDVDPNVTEDASAIETDANDVSEARLEEDSTEAQEDKRFMSLSAEGDVVSFVDVPRYMGTWYEIATTPSFQQAACFGTQAQYTFNEEKGWVDVTNRCYAGSASGNVQEIDGRAELVDLETQAKLQVIFFGQGAPYWVVALDGSEGDEPYAWSVVSVPGGQTMWLLSRTVTMPEQMREDIEEHLRERGFPVDTLIDTPHGD